MYDARGPTRMSLSQYGPTLNGVQFIQLTTKDGPRSETRYGEDAVPRRLERLK